MSKEVSFTIPLEIDYEPCTTEYCRFCGSPSYVEVTVLVLADKQTIYFLCERCYLECLKFGQ